jgi:hypothetical protein
MHFYERWNFKQFSCLRHNPRQTFFRMSAYFHYFALEIKYYYIAVLPTETQKYLWNFPILKVRGEEYILLEFGTV